MKSAAVHRVQQQRRVAPHAGAWIEITPDTPEEWLDQVAPHAGAWIEMMRLSNSARLGDVAPHAGAWIEIRAAANELFDA